MISDEDLMLEFQRGSRAAFEELYARYFGPLYGFFRRRLENSQRAEDLAQEAFLAVIRSTDRYEPRALVRTYLYGIALKLVAAERRRPNNQVELVESAERFVGENPSDTTLWVQQALRRLDPSEREILMLREYEQLSYADIAGLLRLPVNTVRSRLFRARMALRDHLLPREKDHRAMAAGKTASGEANPIGDEA